MGNRTGFGFQFYLLQLCDLGWVTSLLCLNPCICNGEQGNTYLFSSYRGNTWNGAWHVATIQKLSCYCHGGDCELKESLPRPLAAPDPDLDPGQRAAPQVWGQAPGCEGRAPGVARRARTVDDCQVLLISAAMTCPHAPQPATGTRARRLVGPLSLVFHQHVPSSPSPLPYFSPGDHRFSPVPPFLPLSSQRTPPTNENGPLTPLL